jgi:hypothetical protein
MKAYTFLICALLGFAGLAQNTDNYKEQGGSRWVVGGSLDVASGGEIDVESGASLKIAGVAVDASAAELGYLDDAPLTLTFSSVSVASDTATITIQVLDGDGAATSSQVTIVQFFLSDVATGDAITATVPDQDWVVGTDGAIIAEVVTDKYAIVASESDGDIDFLVSHAGGAKTWYMVAVLPTGQVVVSEAITFP